jgi:glycosyltransferase involved in cell wall biosynthesis
MLAAVPRLRRRLRGEQIDVLYSFLYPTSAIAGLAVGMRWRRLDCRWVLGVRSTRLRLNWKRAPFFRLCAWLSPRADLLLANSRGGLDAHRERGFCTRSCRVVANGVDIERFRPSREEGARLRRELGIAADAVVVGRVGRLTAVKDYPTFLRAAARLHERHPHLRFLCVGGGPAAYGAWLEELGRGLGLAGCVTWAGARPDVAALYNAMDVMVSSSRSEGLPNVVAEAMACGVPCVVTDVGESAWLVGELGQAVPPGDAEALATGVEAILARPPSTAALRRRIERQLGLDRMLTATEQALSEALGAGLD